MASLIFQTLFSCFLFALVLLTCASTIPTKPNSITTAYIIQTNNFTRPPHLSTQNQWYSSIIQSISLTAAADNTTEVDRRMFYAYDTVLHGFAATLTKEEAAKAAKLPGVIGVYEDRLLQLYTTRSPDFLALNAEYGLWPDANFGEDVIIGLVDTGIWPESKSFNDAGLPAIPARWRGQCANGTRFNASNCNNKLIGARYFNAGLQAAGLLDDSSDDFDSPRDAVGHGTHTSSTAAGSAVPNANLFGMANGTARGMAPKARIAMYKVCGLYGCMSSDVLAAMDLAIKDGVDVLSISLGSLFPEPFYDDVIAIAAFAAVRHGIFVACAAGNSGPDSYTVDNAAPWITTVGAGSIDRQFTARVVLGSGEVYVGESLNTKRPNDRMVPIIHMADCLVNASVAGKILICEGGGTETAAEVEGAGGVGLIGLNYPWMGEGILVRGFTTPALTVGYFEAQKILAYLNSTVNPVARLEFDMETVLGKSRAPMVAFFSSRGPSSIAPEILKPDVITPGMNILAAWPSETPVTTAPDPTMSDFNIASGTSMACPHAAGLGALLRQAQPGWSPAMIRSAMMTTAVALDNTLRPIMDEHLNRTTPLAIGAGHVYPPMARDPGLVYDAGFQDYVDFLCALNYTEEQMQRFVIGPYACSELQGGGAGLNYPSFVVLFDNATDSRVLRRTLTKVSDRPESYEVRVVNPVPGKVQVSVLPESLEFDVVNEKRSYEVEFKKSGWEGQSPGTVEFAYIIWENSEHQVKSPVMFLWV